MPIQVYIEVNGRPVKTVHIGRASGTAHPDSINTYFAVVKESELGFLPEGRKYTTQHPTTEEWYNGAEFTHRYGDGIEACVTAAFNALKDAGQQVD